jgi:hypothetical protein
MTKTLLVLGALYLLARRHDPTPTTPLTVSDFAREVEALARAGREWYATTFPGRDYPQTLVDP